MALRGVSGIPWIGNDLIPTVSIIGSRVARPQSREFPKETRNQGFTLIELFVVLAIAGILVSFALPGFSNLMLQARLDGGVDKLSQAISFSRNLALNNIGDQTIVICPSTNPEADSPTCAAAATTAYHTGWLVFLDCNNNQVLDAAVTVDCDEDGTIETAAGNDDDREQLMRVQSAFDRIEIESADTNRIVFQRAGRAVSATTFDVRKDGVSYATLTMNLLGNQSTAYNEYFY